MPSFIIADLKRWQVEEIKKHLGLEFNLKTREFTGHQNVQLRIPLSELFKSDSVKNEISRHFDNERENLLHFIDRIKSFQKLKHWRASLK